jgi:AraC-like DNA-binding protein
VATAREQLLVKIADHAARSGTDGRTRGAVPRLRSHALASARDWSVEDVVCTAGPHDPAFEERHACYRIALVGAGTFQCRAAGGLALMTPGSLMLGNPGDGFECSHDHGTGDRCLSFGYRREYFERLAHDAGMRGARGLRALRIPPVRELSPLVARTSAEWTKPAGCAAEPFWEEAAVQLAAAALPLANEARRAPRAPRNIERGVTRAVRLIDHDPAAALSLHRLAREASASPYHFLRMFARLTGLTPHRYVLRARLRRAAAELANSDKGIIDIALDCGFRDVSNFNRAFRAELGTSPRAQRARFRRRAP